MNRFLKWVLSKERPFFVGEIFKPKFFRLIHNIQLVLYPEECLMSEEELENDTFYQTFLKAFKENPYEPEP